MHQLTLLKLKLKKVNKELPSAFELKQEGCSLVLHIDGKRKLTARSGSITNLIFWLSGFLDKKKIYHMYISKYCKQKQTK